METSPLAVGSYVMLIIAGVLHAVAFFTNYWFEDSGLTSASVDGVLDYHIGLWNACYRSASSNGSDVYNVTVVAVTPWTCENTRAWLVIKNKGKRNEKLKREATSESVD
jgi:hypothetical protein